MNSMKVKDTRYFDMKVNNNNDSQYHAIFFSFVKAVIVSFEESYSTENFEVVHHRVNGLDGKVSSVDVTIF